MLKKILNFLIVSSLVFGFSCKNAADNSKAIQFIKTDSFIFDADSARVAAYFPVFNDSLLNSKVRTQILQYCKISLMTDDNKSLENAAKSFAKQGMELRKDYPETPLGKFYANINIDLRSLSDSLVSMSMLTEYYMGGELPIQNALGLNYIVARANFFPSNGIVQNEREVHELAIAEAAKNQQVVQNTPTDKIAFSKDSIFLYYRGEQVSITQIVEVKLPRSVAKIKLFE